MRFWAATLTFAVALFALTAAPDNARSQGQPQPVGPLQPLEIVTKSGVRSFSVELAVTRAELDKGLMFRTELPEGRGMLFDFKNEQIITMWMKNTLISLDMIFIANDGTIVRIADNTTPHSTQTIPSGLPARGVLEVIAGTARKLGIEPGDKVVHPMFRARR